MNIIFILNPFSHRLLITLLTVAMVSSCGIRVKGNGVGRLLQSDCTPIAGHELVIVNRTLNQYLSAGDVSAEYVTTDEDGYFEFDIGEADYLYFYMTKERSSLVRALNRSMKIGSYVSVNELTRAMSSSHENPLIVYPNKDEAQRGGKYVKHINGQYSEKFQHFSSGGSGVKLRFGIRGRDAMFIVSASDGYNVAEVTKVQNGQYKVHEFRNEIVFNNARDIKRKLFLFSRKGMSQSALVSLRQNYDSDTKKAIFLVYRQNFNIPQDKSQALAMNLETCGGHMDRGVEGWYTNTEILAQKSMTWLGTPVVEVDVNSMLQAVGYINSDDAMQMLSDEPRLTQELLVKMIDYDFFDGRYTQSIIDLAKLRGWPDVEEALFLQSRPQIEPQYDDTGRILKRTWRDISTFRFDKKNPSKPETIDTNNMEYVYCMRPRLDDFVSDPNTPDSIMFDIVENFPSFRTLPYLLKNPTSPPKLLEKIYFGDYPARGRAKSYDLLSCDHRLPDSVRKYTLFIPIRECNTDFPQHVIEMIDGTRKKTVLNLDCDAYRTKTLTSLHPEPKIKAFGELHERLANVEHPILGKNIESDESNHNIEGSTGSYFGIMYSLGGNEYYRHLGTNVNLEEEVISPDGQLVTKGIKTLNTRVITKGNLYSHELHQDYALYIQIGEEPWQRGNWTFRIKHKGVILVEKVITVK